LSASDKAETYALTVNFGINDVDPASVSAFENSWMTANVKTYSQCESSCTSECETLQRYDECFTNCDLNGVRDCEITGSADCIVKCGCQNNLCDTWSKEQCKIDCLNESKSPTAPCMLAINGTCENQCQNETFFTNCDASCMENC